MTIKLSPIGNDAPFYKGGVQASGCKLFVYNAGSTTKATTFTDNTGNTQNANPIILNSEGYPASGGNVVEIWVTTGASYKFVLAPSTDSDPPNSPIWTRDNVSGINDASLTLDEWIAGPTPTFVSGTQFTLVGDQTNNFTVGRRVKYSVTAGTGYATITASAFTALTTVTVDSQSSNPLDSGLSAVSYSLLRSDNFTQSIGLDYVTRYAKIIAFTAALNLDAVGGDHVHISSSTSTGTVTSITLSQGHQRLVTVDSPYIFSTSATLLVPTALTTALTGDTIRFRGEPSSIVRAVDFSRASGRPTTIVGGDASLVLIQAQSASNSATIDFTSGITSTYDKYVIEITDLIPATDNSALWLRISQDGGSTFKAGVADYAHNKVGASDTNAPSTTGSTADTRIDIATNLANSTTRTFSTTISFAGAAGTAKVKMFKWQASYVPSTAIANTIISLSGGGFYGTDANAINAVRLLMSSGNITSGTFALYGIRKA